MQLFYFVLVTFLIFSCARSSEKSCQDDVQYAQNCELKEEKIDSVLDREFITKMNENLERNNSKLVDKGVIFDGDTIYFPNVLNLLKNYTLQSVHKKEVLNLKRISNTTIEYQFSSKNSQIKGTAILDPNYFVSQNLDTDTKTKENYGSDEYIDENSTKKEVHVHIRIGRSVNKESKRRAMLYLVTKSNQQITSKSQTLFER